MVGHDEHAFLAESEALALHGRGSHLEGLAGPDLVGEQGVAAVEHVCNRAELVGAEGNVRVHAAERDVGTVVFPGTVGVEELVIAGHQYLPPFGICPDPVLKRLPDGLLFLLGERGLLFIEHAPLFSVGILHGIVDPDVLEI